MISPKIPGDRDLGVPCLVCWCSAGPFRPVGVRCTGVLLVVGICLKDGVSWNAAAANTRCGD
jgi:hypothetical protein